MITPPKHLRLEFWKAAFARSSFIEVLQASRAIVELGDSAPRVIVSALSTTAVVMYARPFKQRKDVKLDPSIVPSGYIDFHEDMIVYRDKAVAHRDVKGPMTPWGTANDLTILSDGTSIEIQTTSPILAVPAAEKLNSLASELVRLMDLQINPFVQNYMPRPLASGSYTLSLEQIETEWLKKQPD